MKKTAQVDEMVEHVDAVDLLETPRPQRSRPCPVTLMSGRRDFRILRNRQSHFLDHEHDQITAAKIGRSIKNLESRVEPLPETNYLLTFTSLRYRARCAHGRAAARLDRAPRVAPRDASSGLRPDCTTRSPSPRPHVRIRQMSAVRA